MSDFLDLGWTAEWQQRFDAAAVRDAFSDEVELARVVRQDRGAVIATSSTETRLAYLDSRTSEVAVVGDWIAMDSTTVTTVLPRGSLLERKDAHSDTAQPIVANVDLVLIVQGADRPVNRRRIERAITQTRRSGATPIIVLTKGDLQNEDASLGLEDLGVDMVTVSSQTGDGMAALQAVTAGKTCVMIGESGAGKSTLLNAFLEAEVVPTGAVREKDAMGRHTTTRRELHVTPFGIVIDTPGVRGLGLWADEEAIAATFPDLQALAEQCRFSDCAHQGEPGCAIAEAVANEAVDPDRIEAWQKQSEEVQAVELRRVDAVRRRPEARSATSTASRRGRKRR